jgi:hypothetical protein
MSRSSSTARASIVSASLSCRRQTKPGLRSASSLTGSSAATKSASSAEDSGARGSEMFTWAMW